MIPESMLAAVYRGEGKVVPESVPVPAIGAGEALVRIDSCGVCGTDLKKVHFGLQPPPRIFGHEMAGVIVALGDGVGGWSVGDRVAVMHHIACRSCYYCSQGALAQCPTCKKTGTTAGFEPAGGGYAQYIRVMDWVVRGGMVRVPDDVTFEEASFVEPVNTVLKAVVRADVRPGQTVLVVGQGQIGLLFTQLVCAKGARPLACDPIPGRRVNALRFGAEAALSPSECDVPSEVRRLTDGRGADLVIVAVADTRVVAMAFEAARPAGTVMLFAQTRLGDTVSVDAGAICMLEKKLIGSYSSDIDLQDEAADLIFRRVLNVRDLITHRYGLDEIEEAFRVAASPRDDTLKIMVKP